MPVPDRPSSLTSRRTEVGTKVGPQVGMPSDDARSEPGHSCESGRRCTPTNVRGRRSRMYQAIVSPQEDQFMAVRPSHSKGMSLPAGYYAELRDRYTYGDVVPDWFVQA